MTSEGLGAKRDFQCLTSIVLAAKRIWVITVWQFSNAKARLIRHDIQVISEIVVDILCQELVKHLQAQSTWYREPTCPQYCQHLKEPMEENSDRCVVPFKYQCLLQLPMIKNNMSDQSAQSI